MRAAGGGPDPPVSLRERRPQGGRDRHRVSGARVDHRAEQRPARRRAGRHQRANAGVGQLELEAALARVRVLQVEYQHRRLGADAERPQATTELVGIEAAAQGLRQQIAGEAALGLPNDALSHQLEADHHRALSGGQPLELAERATLADDDEPRDGGAAAPSGDRNGQRAVRQRRVLWRERGHRPGRPHGSPAPPPAP